MCMGATLIEDSNGVNVRNRPYDDNESFRDEWIIINSQLSHWYSDNNTLYYWETDPKVYVEVDESILEQFTSSHPYNTDDDYIAIVDEAINIINQNFGLQIQRTETAILSDIRIYFTERNDFKQICMTQMNKNVEVLETYDGLTVMSGDFELYKYYDNDQKSIYSLNKSLIGIFKYQDFNGSVLHVVLHELTHAIGWIGHYNTQNTIMYASSNYSESFLPEEVKHLKQLYDERNMYYES